MAVGEGGAEAEAEDEAVGEAGDQDDQVDPLADSRGDAAPAAALADGRESLSNRRSLATKYHQD